MKNTLLEQLVEAVEDTNFKKVTAYEKHGYLCLRFNALPVNTDSEAVEDAMMPILEDLCFEFNVDFDIVLTNGRTVALEVIA